MNRNSNSTNSLKSELIQLDRGITTTDWSVLEPVTGPAHATIDMANCKKNRLEFWQEVGNVVLWLLSVTMMLGLFTAGSWLPAVMIAIGFSK